MNTEVMKSAGRSLVEFKRSSVSEEARSNLSSAVMSRRRLTVSMFPEDINSRCVMSEAFCE